jgi:glycosyltransferase involved in cell wall biosynthesis
MSRPKISLVVPSYQQAPFLAATLDTILQQDYLPSEVLIEDGGSTDGSVAIIERYALQYPELIRYRSGHDGGQVQAINLGLAKASGEICAYLNSDDLLAPGALARVADYFANHPEAHLLYGQADYVDQAGQLLKPYPVKPWNRERLRATCFICQPACFWRRAVYTTLGPFDERYQCAFDYEYWLRALSHYPFHFLPEKLAFSRAHTDAKSFAQKRQSVEETWRVQQEKFPRNVPFLWLRKLAVVRAFATLPAQPRRRDFFAFTWVYWRELVQHLSHVTRRERTQLFWQLSPPFTSAARRKINPLADLQP